MMRKQCCLLALQAELFSKLSGSLGCGVYDVPPDGAAYPYVSIGEDDASDAGTKNSHGDEVTCLFHIWSRSAGFMEAKTIMADIVGILTAVSFSVPGFQVAMMRVIYRNVSNDPDGVTRHGVLWVGFQLFQE